MNIEQLKELAVRVEDGLPTEKDVYVTITDEGEFELIEFVGGSFPDFVTHYFDFDLLTTKAKAMEMIKMLTRKVGIMNLESILA